MKTLAFVGLLCLGAGAAHAETFEVDASEKLYHSHVSSRRMREAIADDRLQRLASAGKPAYALECAAVGFRKLVSQAKSFGIKVDMKTFRISEADDRPDNPSKYLWWSVDVTDINGRTDVFPPGKKPVLSALTQKASGYACF